MNVAFINLQAAAGADFASFIPLILIVIIMYFFIIRPNNKRRKEAAQFRNNLQIGQDVITAGGIYGKVKSLEEDGVVVLEIASGVKIRIDKNSIYANAAATQQQA